MTTPLDPRAFSFPESLLWVAACSDAPLPRVSAQAVRDWLASEETPWSIDWPAVLAGVADTRAAAAEVIGVQSGDITLVPSTSTALAMLAHAFPWEDGDEVLAPLGEFPSNAWPWLSLSSLGVTFREAPLWEGHRAGTEALGTRPPHPDDDPEETLLQAIGPRTRMLVLSWVRFQDGLKLDLRRLGSACRRRNIALVVDGIQGCGTHLPDLAYVDAFTAGGQKGLLAPQGTALLWTAPAFRALLVPTGSWLSVFQGGDFSLPLTDLQRPWLPDGRRLENQASTSLQVFGFRASLRLLAQADVSVIEAHVTTLQRRLLAGLGEDPRWFPEASRLRGLLDDGRLGPILCFHPATVGVSGWDALLAEGQRLGIHATQREGFLRLALHGWHSPDDVDRLVAWLKG